MCTAIGIMTKQGLVSGRTMEYPTGSKYEPFNTIYLPRGYTTPNVNDINVKSKYGVIGSGHYGKYTLCDGINEHGLSGSANLFPQLAYYSKKTSKDLGFAPHQILGFLLGQCKDCNEVKEILKKIEILDIPVDESDFVWPMHMAIFDKNGESIVIEPCAKENDNGIFMEETNNGVIEYGSKPTSLTPVIKVYDNPLRVMTNSPNYSYHRANMANFTHLSSNRVTESDFKIRDEYIKSFGQGSGMSGIPGDFVPASRFIRACFFVHNSPVFTSSMEGILQVRRILHQFDIPFGSVKTTEGNFEVTHYIGIMDNVNQKYYLYHHKNINVLELSLKDFLDLKDPKEIYVMPRI